MANYNYYLNYLRNKNEANPLAFMLRAVENTEWNHVEISREPTYEDNPLYFGAVYPEYRMATKEELSKHYRIIKRRKLSPIVGTLKCKNTLEKYIGTKYSLLQNLVIFFKLTMIKLRSFWSSVKLNLDERLNCTEAAAIFLNECCGKNIPNTEVLSLKDMDNDEFGELDLNFKPEID